MKIKYFPTLTRLHAYTLTLLYAGTLALWHSGTLGFGAVLQNQGFGAAAVGLGQAVTGAGAANVYGIYYNPAQLASLSYPEISMDYARLLMGLTDNSQISQTFVGFAYPAATQGFGFAYSNFILDPLYREDILYAAFGQEARSRFVGGALAWGVNLKNIRRDYGRLNTMNNALDNVGQATGRVDPVFAAGSSQSRISLDLATHWRHDAGWSLGASFSDLNEPDLALGNEKDRLYRGIHCGAAYHRGQYFMVVAEFELKKYLPSQYDRRWILGAEKIIPTRLLGSFALRGSLGFGPRLWRAVSLGTSWRINAMSIDYGFMLPLDTIESINGSHRLSLTFRFGYRESEEEIMDLYKQERKAREKLERQLDVAFKDLERLLEVSESQVAQASSRVAAEELPRLESLVTPAAVKAAIIEQEKAQAQSKRYGEFLAAWKLYEEHKQTGASRGELLAILRQMMNTYGDGYAPLKQEFKLMLRALDEDRQEFELIFQSYRRLALMRASPEVLAGSLKRMLKRFEGTGVDLTEVYHEIERINK